MLMFRKLLAASALPFLFLTHAHGQNKPIAESILAHRSVDEHLSWYLNGELLLDHVDLVRHPGTKVAIRVCTKLPVEEASRKSRGAPFVIANFLKIHHSYTPERILILFSEMCPMGTDKKIYIAEAPPTGEKKLDIEVWVVPQGAMSPPAEKVYKANELEDYLMSEQMKRGKYKQRSKGQPRHKN